MTYLLDTNIASDAIKGEPARVRENSRSSSRAVGRGAETRNPFEPTAASAAGTRTASRARWHRLQARVPSGSEAPQAVQTIAIQI